MYCPYHSKRGTSSCVATRITTGSEIWIVGCSSVVIANPLIVDQTIKEFLFLHFTLNQPIKPSLSQSPQNHFIARPRFDSHLLQPVAIRFWLHMSPACPKTL